MITIILFRFQKSYYYWNYFITIFHITLQSILFYCLSLHCIIIKTLFFTISHIVLLLLLLLFTHLKFFTSVLAGGFSLEF